MEGRCAICRRWSQLEEHHVFPGAYRKKSGKYKATIKICHSCHVGKDGIQYNRRLADRVKAAFQARIMRQEGWDKQKFIQEFGKNYIEE